MTKLSENNPQGTTNIADDSISCSVISCSCELIERTYHLKIEYNSDEYFFLVETLDGMLTGGNQQITSIRRCITPYDCGKLLKNYEKKKIKRTIEAAFNLD